MKKVLISGLIALISTIWAIAICVFVVLNPVTTWMNSLFWETAARRGVLLPLLLSLLLLFASLINLIAQYFKKEK